MTCSQTKVALHCFSDEKPGVQGNATAAKYVSRHTVGGEGDPVSSPGYGKRTLVKDVSSSVVLGINKNLFAVLTTDKPAFPPETSLYL